VVPQKAAFTGFAKTVLFLTLYLQSQVEAMNSLAAAASSTASEIIAHDRAMAIKLDGPTEKHTLTIHAAEDGVTQSNGSQNVAVALVSSQPSTAQTAGITIPLWKQYVPIVKNGKVVAYKTAYYGQIHAGSPELDDFTAVFDTGSGHVILPSTACTSEICVKHNRYNRSKSDTALDVDADGSFLRPYSKDRDLVNIEFGTGEIFGEFVQDRVCIGQQRGCATTRLIAATSMTEDPFGVFAFDGVLGLGLSALTLDSKFNFFAQLVDQNPGMQPYFGVFLARSEADGDSLITFGGMVKDRITEDIQWIPVAMSELGYWQVQLKGVRMGDAPLEECADGSCRAILDTGTSLLGVPQMSARRIHRLLARQVPQEYYANPTKIDCRRLPGHLVNFDLTPNVSVTLQPEDYSRPVPFNMTVPGGTKARLFCRSLLLPVDMAPPLGPKIFLWGEPVLRRYYTVYDFKNKRIGLAPSKHIDDPPAEDEAGLHGHALVSGAPLASSRNKAGLPRSPQPKLSE